ncbi:ATP-binding cassette domain-containing protein [Paracoccus cavernae]|uniref:ATP-binding cassette domain-containing protein n=1 Tax=Paracoccus cavernae TaxID=1571207 RepID=A0ABT8DBK6_9RHOB|nr:ATP-binding cassette domain-containing protein [Paracoccus cavernae]
MGLTIEAAGFTWPSGLRLFDGLDLAQPEGDRIVITGGNGAGKSTLARLIAGQAAPDRGRVLWHGRAWSDMTRAERAATVQLVGQRPDLLLSGRAASLAGEIAFGPENLGLPRSEIAARLEAAQSAMGLSHLAHRDPRQLSGGEAQRLAIASALAMRPALLVLDEALTDLDRQSRDGLADRLLAFDPAMTVIALDVAAEHWLAQGFRHAAELAGGRLHPPTPTIRPTRAIAPIGTGSPSAAPLVTIRDLGFAHPESAPLFTALDLSLPAAAAIAVTGPNGAGKSSLMRLIAGLMRPSAGEISVAGLPVGATKPRALAAKLGMVFQNADRQFVTASLLAEAALAPRLHGQKDPARAALDALAAVGLQESAARHPLDLDNGGRRLAAVAAAIAHQPALVILDETQRGLDPDHRARLESVIAAIRKRSGTVLFVCHDEEFVARNATHRLAVAAGSAVLCPPDKAQPAGGLDALRPI